MSAEETERERVRALVKMGVNQKIIASRIGMSEASLSRWLNKQPKQPRFTLAAAERLQQFAEELATVALGLRGVAPLIAAAVRVKPEFEDLALDALQMWSARGTSAAPASTQTTRPRESAQRARGKSS